MNTPTPIAVTLIAIVTAVVSLRGFQTPGFAAKYLLDVQPIVQRREGYRLLTSGFLHANWTHLAFNMYSFWSFGRIIELVLGAPFLLAVYFAAILGGGLFSLYLHRDEEYRALGASGGVSGVIFATVFLFPGGSVRMFLVPIDIPSWVFALVFVLGSFVAMRRGRGNIGHDAHLAGALCGLLVATVLEPSIPSRSPVLFTAVVVLMASLIVYGRYVPAWKDPWAPGGTQALRDRWNALWTAPPVSDEERLNELLNKISEQGLPNLTPAERTELEALSRRREGR